MKTWVEVQIADAKQGYNGKSGKYFTSNGINTPFPNKPYKFDNKNVHIFTAHEAFLQVVFSCVQRAWRPPYTRLPFTSLEEWYHAQETLQILFVYIGEKGLQYAYSKEQMSNIFKSQAIFIWKTTTAQKPISNKTK